MLFVAVLAAAFLAGGSGAREQSGIVGSWHVKPSPFPKAPWAKGGDTVTIQTTTQSAALPVISSAPQYADGKSLFCGATFEKPTEHPGATWFRLTYTWSGGGTMMGCSTMPAQGSGFFSGSQYASLVVVAGGLHGSWQSNWGDPSTSFPLDLTPGAADTGGGTAPAKTGKTKTLTEPGPGGSVTTSSPQPLPDDCPRSVSARSSVQIRCSVDFTVSSSSGDLKGTTIVGEGEVTVSPKSQKVGEAIAACWLLGPDAVEISNAGVKAFVNSALFKEAFSTVGPRYALVVCENLAILGFFGKEPVKSRIRSVAAAGGCHAQRFRFAFREANGRIASVGLTKSRPTATSVRYSCTASGGTVKVTVDGRVKGGLRKALGTKLDLGVVRSKKAPKRASKLSFKFAW